MILVCIAIVYPLYYVLLASVTDPAVVSSGKLLLLPEKVQIYHYRRLFSYKALWIGYANAVKYTLSGTALSLACTIPAGYALSRKDLCGRRVILFLFTFSMFFSGGMIPMYLTVRGLGIYNTIFAMILPVAVSAYNLIVCRSFFENTLQDELFEAARLDGCSDFGFFFRIVLPLSPTIMVVMALFYGNAMWNQYFNALMFLRDEDKMPLQVVLQTLLHMNQQMKYCLVVAGAVPMIVVYPFAQKYFQKGVVIGSVKG